MKTPAILFILILILQSFTGLAQVGVHTDFPDNSAAMDIVATNRGLLIPRVTLTNNLSSPSPITAPAVGLLVFNSGANQAIGFYYWSGSTWVFLSASAPGGSFWSITGNAGTTPGTNFLGTTDNQHFLVYTNNAERMRFESDGQIVIDSIAPRNATDLFTVIANPTQKSAINAYSTTGTGFYTKGGRYGLFAQVDTAVAPTPGTAVFARNYDPLGYGTISVGSNISTFVFNTTRSAGVTTYGVDGLHAYGRNANGFGILAVGSNGVNPFNLTGVTAGISSIGNYGIISRGTSTSGRGIIAIGSGETTPSTSLESEGGAFTGYHGVYGKGKGIGGVTPPMPFGIGVIGVGYNFDSYSGLLNKSLGGSFSGDYGVYGKGLNATDGIGVLGVGSGGLGYYFVSNGSGGAFTGYHGSLSVGTNAASGIGMIGAGNDGIYNIPSFGAGGSFTGTTIGVAGFGTSVGSGIGVIGAGNGAGALYPTNTGAGGAFSGIVGLYSQSVAANGTGIIGLGNNIIAAGTFASGSGGSFIGTAAGVVAWGATAATGTGIIGVGNNIAAPLTYAGGGGGAFTGTDAGLVAYGTTASSGVGVIGAGNNVAPVLPGATGCGGAFTGTVCGIYGYATSSSNLRYGGYFAAAGNVNASGVGYAYVGGRAVAANGTTYQSKIVGAGTVQTIVKNTDGELIALTCPEAPEMVFQDFGVGQLVDGHCHITIDPDLAINLNVSNNHPLKVYITPEGDCNGVYVTNKSAFGFDVIELKGGNSNVSFSWQIVATRGNEEFISDDGSVEISDYSHRFPPAPGPMEMVEQPAIINQMTTIEMAPLETITAGKESFKTDQTHTSDVMKVQEDEVIENKGNMDE